MNDRSSPRLQRLEKLMEGALDQGLDTESLRQIEELFVRPELGTGPIMQPLLRAMCLEPEKITDLSVKKKDRLIVMNSESAEAERDIIEYVEASDMTATNKQHIIRETMVFPHQDLSIRRFLMNGGEPAPVRSESGELRSLNSDQITPYELNIRVHRNSYQPDHYGTPTPVNAEAETIFQGKEGPVFVRCIVVSRACEEMIDGIQEAVLEFAQGEISSGSYDGHLKIRKCFERRELPLNVMELFRLEAETGEPLTFQSLDRLEVLIDRKVNSLPLGLFDYSEKLACEVARTFPRDFDQAARTLLGVPAVI